MATSSRRRGGGRGASLPSEPTLTVGRNAQDQPADRWASLAPASAKKGGSSAASTCAGSQAGSSSSSGASSGSGGGARGGVGGNQRGKGKGKGKERKGSGKSNADVLKADMPKVRTEKSEKVSDKRQKAASFEDTASLEADVGSNADNASTAELRPSDVIFCAIRHVAEQNSALQHTDFDYRVRQHFHAFFGQGGADKVKEASAFIQKATMAKERRGVKNWPAYILALCRKFDQEVGNLEREARAKARIVAAGDVATSDTVSCPELDDWVAALGNEPFCLEVSAPPTPSAPMSMPSTPSVPMPKTPMPTTPMPALVPSAMPLTPLSSVPMPPLEVLPTTIFAAPGLEPAVATADRPPAFEPTIPYALQEDHSALFAAPPRIMAPAVGYPVPPPMPAPTTPSGLVLSTSPSHDLDPGSLDFDTSSWLPWAEPAASEEDYPATPSKCLVRIPLDERDTPPAIEPAFTSTATFGGCPLWQRGAGNVFDGVDAGGESKFFPGVACPRGIGMPR